MPRLSEMPGFVPAGEPGSPERRACALTVCTNTEANLDFVRMLARMEVQRRLAFAQQQPQHTPSAPAVLNGVTHGA